MSQYRSQNVSSIFLNQGVTCPSSLESLQACGRRHCLGTQARWLPHACSSSSPVSGPAVGTCLGHPDTCTLVDSLFRRDQLQGGAEVGPRCSPGNATRGGAHRCILPWPPCFRGAQPRPTCTPFRLRWRVPAGLFSPCRLSALDVSALPRRLLTSFSETLPPVSCLCM